MLASACLNGKLSKWFSFHPDSDANKTHFHKKSCAFGLILKVKVFGTWKWPVDQGMVRWTAHFVFLFLQGYDSIDNPKAVSALKYMLLCKIMLNRLVRIWYHQDLSQSEIHQRCFWFSTLQEILGKDSLVCKFPWQIPLAFIYYVSSFYCVNGVLFC